jgi:hypothetical protein
MKETYRDRRHPANDDPVAASAERLLSQIRIASLCKHARVNAVTKHK